jgi:hypothetical protein
MKSKIKTAKDAFKLRGVDIKAMPDVSMLPKEHSESLIAYYQLFIVTEAINFEENNKVWRPDWNDASEYKYYPWFKVKADSKNPSGSGLSYGGYGLRGTVTAVGSRLCFVTRERAEYAGKQFADLYAKAFLFLK